MIRTRRRTRATHYRVTPGSLSVRQGEHFAVQLQGSVLGFQRPFTRIVGRNRWVVNPRQTKQLAMRKVIEAALLERANAAGEDEVRLVFPRRTALILRATFFYHRPQSHFISGGLRNVRDLRPAHRSNEMVQTPDLDNLVKFIMDRPLEGVIYGNDMTIVEMRILKLWDDADECTGRTDIKIDLRRDTICV